MQPDLDDMAAEVVLLVKASLAPVLERLAVAESRLSALGDVRDRLVIMETKTAMPLLQEPGIDLTPVHTRLNELDARISLTAGETALALTKELGALRERVAVVEVRPQLQGPPGEPGQPGKDGADGTAGLSFEGVYQDGKSYDLGNLVTWAGSSWHCNEQTTTKPGDGSKAWTLMVKRGRDGKDGSPGPDGKPGRDLTKEAAWRS